MALGKIILKQNEVYSKYLIGNDLEDSVLGQVGKINIFVGANNSGKSKLLRELFISFYKKKNEGYLPFEEDGGRIPLITYEGIDLYGADKEKIKIKLSFIIDEIIEEGMEILKEEQLADLRSFEKVLDKKKYSFLTYHELVKMYDFLSSSTYIRPKISLGENNNISIEYPRFSQAVSNLKKSLNELFEYVNIFHVSYIPMLRTIKKIGLFKEFENEYIDRYSGEQQSQIIKKYQADPSFNPLLDKVYIDYFRERLLYEHKKNSDVRDNIFTGEQLFELFLSLQSSVYEERKVKEEFENFLSLEFFGGEKISITAVKGENSNVFIKIGDSEEYPIYLLGDGIQAVIIQSLLFFIHQDKNHIVFIEEPETNLHPGYQRTLLTLINKFPKMTVFITTHSNHLLDLSLDLEHLISVYHFKKLSKDEQLSKGKVFSVENILNPDENILLDLGVKNSSVFLTNATIWVEGITDRIYIRKFFTIFQDELLQKDPHRVKYLEDIHYSFVEYGGGNITHWSFLEETEEVDFKSINVERICAKLFLITDQDSTNVKPGKKTSRIKKLKERLGKRFYCLNCREIENLLMPHTIKAVISEMEANKGNTALFEEFSQYDYKDVYIGEFINKVCKNRKRNYASESGTLKNKVSFSKKAAAHLNLSSDLSEETRSLCEKIYNFVKEKNL